MAIGGVYCLFINVEKNIVVSVGSLGVLSFLTGQYVYVGSALNGVRKRVLRHINTSLGSTNTVFWHIDYLLRKNEVNIQSIHVQTTDQKIECEIAKAFSRKSEPIKGFGSSDCNCISHLFQVEEYESSDKFEIFTPIEFMQLYDMRS